MQPRRLRLGLRRCGDGYAGGEKIAADGVVAADGAVATKVWVRAPAPSGGGKRAAGWSGRVAAAVSALLVRGSAACAAISPADWHWCCGSWPWLEDHPFDLLGDIRVTWRHGCGR
jgi:hypothetical protein